MRCLRWMGFSALPVPPFGVRARPKSGLARKHLRSAAAALPVALLFACTVLLSTLCGCETKTESAVKQVVTAAEGATLTSSDGRMTLEIPAGALTEDTEVTLSLVPEEDWTDDTRAVEPVGSVYRLEPEGLELLEPAEFTLHLQPTDLAGLELPEGAFPACTALTRSEDGQWESLENPTTKIDVDTGEVLVTGGAKHFSVAVVRNYWLTVYLNPKSEQKAPRQPWWATVTIQNRSERSFFICYFESVYTAAVIGVPTRDLGLESFYLGPFEKNTLDRIPFQCWRTGGGRYGLNFRFISDEEVHKMSEEDYQKFTQELQEAGLLPRYDRDLYLIRNRDVIETLKDKHPYLDIPGPPSFSLRLEITGAAVCEYELEPRSSGSGDSSAQTTTTVVESAPEEPKSPPAAETGIGSLSLEGSWKLYAAGEQVRLDFQMRVSVKGQAPGDFYITQINYYRDDMQTPKWSSDSASLPAKSTVFPSGQRPWIFRSFVDPGLHTARVEAFASDGQRFVRTWEINCVVEPGEESSTTTTQPSAEEEVVCELSFAHVAPGEYSELYLGISGPPGAAVDVTLSGPGVASPARQTGTLDANGNLFITWLINQFGTYSVSGTVGGTPVSSSVQVQ